MLFAKSVLIYSEIAFLRIMLQPHTPHHEEKKTLIKWAKSDV